MYGKVTVTTSPPDAISDIRKDTYAFELASDQEFDAFLDGVSMSSVQRKRVLEAIFGTQA